jgi:hypothetical protein
MLIPIHLILAKVCRIGAAHPPGNSFFDVACTGCASKTRLDLRPTMSRIIISNSSQSAK